MIGTITGMTWSSLRANMQILGRFLHAIWSKICELCKKKKTQNTPAKTITKSKKVFILMSEVLKFFLESRGYNKSLALGFCCANYFVVFVWASHTQKNQNFNFKSSFFSTSLRCPRFLLLHLFPLRILLQFFFLSIIPFSPILSTHRHLCISSFFLRRLQWLPRSRITLRITSASTSPNSTMKAVPTENHPVLTTGAPYTRNQTLKMARNMPISSLSFLLTMRVHDESPLYPWKSKLR